ncbi:MAG: type I 3-dehydroquinate dehydratase [Clostridiales bacterium]|nr:type I 3-dehydroquinate dehydratase [Clostridiales bacterium]
MEPVTVRGLTIGTGRPKIAVPVLGETQEALLAEAEQVKAVPADLAEWRVDWFARWSDRTALLEAGTALRAALGELPILATFRTAKEGGRREIPQKDYVNLIRALASSGLADMVDIEAFTAGEAISSLIGSCHRAGVLALLSSHDFERTPEESEMVRRLTWMDGLGADISKLAVMPRSRSDVLALLSATGRAAEQARRPVVTMSMGGLGAVSRLAGEVFGSAITFGSAARASAPGQIPAGQLAEILALLEPGEPFFAG